MAATLEEQNNIFAKKKINPFFPNGKEFLLLFSPSAWPLQTHSIRIKGLGIY